MVYQNSILMKENVNKWEIDEVNYDEISWMDPDHKKTSKSALDVPLINKMRQTKTKIIMMHYYELGLAWYDHI